MARSQMRHSVGDSAGNVIENALCNVYLTGTTTPVSDMYADASGGSPITTLTSNAQGEVVGWFTTAKVVDIEVTDNSETAFYPSVPANLLTWTAFTETVEIPGAASGASVQGARRVLGPCKIRLIDAQEFQGIDTTDMDGTYTLAHDGDTTTALAWDADAAAIQAALEALTSIGAGNVTVTLFGASALGDGFLMEFAYGVPTELVVADGTNLTGDSSPYNLATAVVIYGQSHWRIEEMFTPAAGDWIYNFSHSCPEAFDGLVKLYYTDTPSNASVQSSPEWTIPQGSSLDGLLLGANGSYTNFSAPDSPQGADGMPDVISAFMADWIGDGSTFYVPIPTEVTVSTPIYAKMNVDSAVTSGEVWIYVEVSTPDPTGLG